MSNENMSKKTYAKPEIAEMGYLNRFMNDMKKANVNDGKKFYFPSAPASYIILEKNS